RTCQRVSPLQREAGTAAPAPRRPAPVRAVGRADRRVRLLLGIKPRDYRQTPELEWTGPDTWQLFGDTLPQWRRHPHRVPPTQTGPTAPQQEKEAAEV